MQFDCRSMRFSNSLKLVGVGLAFLPAAARPEPHAGGGVTIVGEAERFAPASTDYSEIRLTISPDGRIALWFSRNRPGGPGGYDIWISTLHAGRWSEARPVPFNSASRDFDPAFSPDGRYVFFCSDRPGGSGGDDIYRVAVKRSGFGTPENLGAFVNSPANEFSPMLSPDRSSLVYSSDRPGGAGRHDLFVADRTGSQFGPARRLAGAVNTTADEFDPTFLGDSKTIVFARAPNFTVDRVDLYYSTATGGHYGWGVKLPLSVNDAQKDSYAPMLDWSRPNRLTFSGQRSGAKSMDVYGVDYRLDGRQRR